MVCVRSWSPLFLLLAVAGAQDLPPYDLPADVAAKIRGLTQAEPLQLLARLASMDLKVRAAADEQWDGLDARAQCALVRAGLRATDREVAIGAAAKAGAGSWLDTREQKRAATVGMARCNVENTPFDVAEFFQMFDARDTAHFLANPGEMPHEVPQFFGPLHHRFGPEHQAQVELLTRSDDVLVRQDAAKYLGVVKIERARYAHFLLAQPLEAESFPDDFEPQRDKSPFAPRAFTLRPAGDGYPPLLAAVIERLFLTEAPSTPQDRVFAWRWARDSKPGAIDGQAVPRLLRCEHEEGQRIGMLGIGLVGDDGAALLAELGAKADGERLAPLQALAEATRRGDAAARARLAGLAADKPLALAVQWRCDRAAAEATVAIAFGAEAAAGVEAMQRLADAARYGAWWGETMVGLDEVLRTGSESAPLDGARLAVLLDEFPAVRSRALCRLATAALTAGPGSVAPLVELGSTTLLGVLELGDLEGLVAGLHALLARPDLPAEPRSKLVTVLSRLGKAGVGDAAQASEAWRATWRFEDADDGARARIQFAATGSPTIVALLQDAVVRLKWSPGQDTAGLVGALAAADGIDPRLAFDLASELGQMDGLSLAKAQELLREPLLAGDGVGAMARYLAARPLERGCLGGLGRLPGAAGRTYLQRYRDEREHGLYCQATGELARGGDAEARAEVESAIERRLYGWIDYLDGDVLTDGRSLDRVPLLLRQVDSNCCTFAVIATALEDVFECDPFITEHGTLTRPEVVHDAWARAQGRLAWSRIAERWLIAPK